MSKYEGISKDDFFFCYTKSMSLFLREKGISYIFKGKSIKDSNIFTLYLKGEKLQNALDEYKGTQ